MELNKKKEIGGYLELGHFHESLYHEYALALNSGRNCLAYLIEARKIHTLFLPKFLCDSVLHTAEACGVQVIKYSITEKFEPCIPAKLPEDAWLYCVNYYGQVSNERIEALVAQYPHIIVDNAQSFYSKPIHGVDTLYTARKFFGVPDGAYLYTDAVLSRALEQDVSYTRMEHILGRFETSGAEFYSAYSCNEDILSHVPLKKMSRLTDNLLHGIDYSAARQRRNENFLALDHMLGKQNELRLSMPEGAFMYPFLMQDGRKLRKKLQLEKIYVPTLWPNVLQENASESIEYHLATDLLPLPIDQRYNRFDMEIIAKCIKELVGEKSDEH
jgi:hypothetical protein